MAWAVLPVAGVLLLAGCSDDDKKDDKPAASTAATTPASNPAPATSASAPAGGAGSSAPAAGAASATFNAEQKAAADAYTKLFDASTPAAERKALIQDADKFTALIDGMLASPVVGQVKADVKDVKVEGDKATVTYDVVMGGSPVAPGTTGPAVKQDGKWKVGAKTICGFASYVQMQAPADCANY